MSAEEKADNLDQRFAAQVRRWREIRGLSQAEIASRMAKRGHAYRQQTIGRIENSTRAVPVGEAFDLAKVLQVKLEMLLQPIIEIDMASLEEELRRADAAVADAASAFESARMEAHVAEDEKEVALMRFSSAAARAAQCKDVLMSAEEHLQVCVERLHQAQEEIGSPRKEG